MGTDLHQIWTSPTAQSCSLSPQSKDAQDNVSSEETCCGYSKRLPARYFPPCLSFPFGTRWCLCGNVAEKVPLVEGEGWWCEFCGMGQPQTSSSWGEGLRLQALIHHPDCGGNHTVHFLPLLLLIIPRSVYEKIQFFLLDE